MRLDKPLRVDGRTVLPIILSLQHVPEGDAHWTDSRTVRPCTTHLGEAGVLKGVEHVVLQADGEGSGGGGWQERRAEVSHGA